MNDPKRADADEHARDAGGSIPDAVDLPPSPGNTPGDQGSTRDIAVDRAAGGGIEGSGEVDLHGGDEGLREVPAGEDPVEAAAQDFMDVDRSRHA